MTGTIQGRTSHARPAAGWPGRVLAALAVLAGLAVLPALALLPGRATAQQANFKPLERGEYTEVEERVMVARGLEVGADYAARVRHNNQDDLPPLLSGTEAGHDLRLRLNTVMHRDAEIRLTLQLGQEPFTGTNLREASEETGQLNDSLSTAIFAREAYLRYNFNPGSGLVLGKQELSLGDRRGKVFHALVPGFTFDCKAGTWCVPMGVARVGPQNADAITHFALTYNAWNEPYAGDLRDRLRVEVFRVLYNENNVPLGRNFGPTVFDAEDPVAVLPSQVVDPGANEPIYYDADGQNFYGFRVQYAGGPLFVDFDVTGYRGVRRYHLYDGDGRATTPGDLSATGTEFAEQSVRGTAVETQLGWRWARGRFGLRAMSATGDEYTDPTAPSAYLRDLSGYYEVTPGSYAGTRLWFNGSDADVSLGGGLGHSINNTQLIGLFVDYADPEKQGLGYSGGVYSLTLNNPIPDSQGELQDRIGVEVDNMLTWYAHKAIRIELELNGIVAQGAFRVSDTDVPNAVQDNFYQFIGRFVYSF